MRKLNDELSYFPAISCCGYSTPNECTFPTNLNKHELNLYLFVHIRTNLQENYTP